MSFAFRHRIELSQRGVIDIDKRELVLSQANEEQRVVLSTGSAQQSLKEAERIVLGGQGYATEDEAWQAGLAWRSVLERMFAALRVGADFGDRAPKGGLSRAGKKLLEDASGGRRVLDDNHGLMVYQTDPAPAFARFGPVVGLIPARLKRIQQALPAARSSEPTSPAESIAFELFSASLRTRGIADARFMLLMMALETLIDQQPRSAKAGRHVETLIDLSETADLEPGDRDSIRRALEDLKNESIGRAGRRLVAKLGDRTYAGFSPRDFFNRCYRVRSLLVHGEVPRPTREEVGRLAASLEVLVGQLIAGPDVLAAVDQPR